MRRYLAFLLLLLLIAVGLRIDFFFTIVYFLGAIYLLSRLWIERIPPKLRVERDFADHAFIGERVPVTLRIRNTGWLPVPWLEVSESLPPILAAVAFEPQVLVLGPHDTWTHTYTLLARRRGYYTLGPLNLQIGDLLGIAHDSLRGPEPRRLTVYPRIVPLQQLGLPTRSPMVALPARSPLFEDPNRLLGVRDYRRGDAPRRIHWSATAHAGRLVVKQYEPAIARETLIALDLEGDNYDRHRLYEATELAIVVAASLATHIIVREGLAVGLLTEARDPVDNERRRFQVLPRAERAHLVGNLLEPLARVQIAEGTDFAALLREASVHFAFGLTLTVITGRASQALLDTLLYLQRHGFAVVLILVLPPSLPSPLAGASDSARLPVYKVWKEEDLEVLQ